MNREVGMGKGHLKVNLTFSMYGKRVKEVMMVAVKAFLYVEE